MESSFVFASSPRHIIDKAIENVPPGLPIEEWTYQRKFEASWEALRAEYQPSTAVDLSQLRDQIFALNDEGPGGFDRFRADFHRLHTEILATRVPDAIQPRELNGIVRDGIRNPTIWALVCHNLYREDPNAPWEQTFEAISALLTSFRQKGMDPYGENKSGPIIGHQSVAANVVGANTADRRPNYQNKRSAPTRDQGGRFQKSQRTTITETTNQGKQQWTSSQTTTKSDNNSNVNSNRSDSKCTRCWRSTSHGFKECTESKCVCGKTLSPGQVVCYNYDAHPSTAQFKDKIPRSVAIALEAYRQGKASTGVTTQGGPTTGKGNPGVTTRGKGKKSAKAFAATIAEELARRGVTDESLDHSA